jgi:hypothetical protein
MYHDSGIFYKNVGRLWRVSDCEELVGVTWKVSDCEELVGVTHTRIIRQTKRFS